MRQDSEFLPASELSAQRRLLLKLHAALSWSGAADLFLKERHHASVGTQDVAEAHRNKVRGGFLRKRVDVTLGKMLGDAHHAGRTHSFVGGNKDETQNAEFFGQVGEDFGDN